MGLDHGGGAQGLHHPERPLQAYACSSRLFVQPYKTNFERGFAFAFAFLVAVAAIKATHGKVYGYGPSAKVIYVASGGADDWTYGARNVTWSYSVELRDTGTSTREDSFLGLISRASSVAFASFRSLRLRVAGQRDRAHWAGDLRRGARDGQLHPRPHLVALSLSTLWYEPKKKAL